MPSFEVLLSIRERQEYYWKNGPNRVEVRRNAENIARPIIEENIGGLSIEQIKDLMNFLNIDSWKGDIRHDRFGSLLVGENRNRILGNDLSKLNELFSEIYLSENLDAADRLISDLHGVSDGFVSCLLYLKDRDRFNISIPKTRAGIKIAFSEAELESGKFKERYLQFNKLANELKQKCELESQLMDAILVWLGETET